MWDCLTRVDLPGGEVVTFTTRAPYKIEEPNEDALAFIDLPRGDALLVVADGVGGLPRGDYASRLIVERLGSALCDASNEDASAAAVAAIESAHETLTGSGGGAASTVVAVHLDGNRFRSLHVGDSIALVSSQRGKSKFETISHSPIGYALESGLISEEDAFAHEERHVVSNLVGGDNLHITVSGSMQLAVRDTLLLASDGLSDNLRQAEIIEAIRVGPLFKAGERLVSLALERMEGGGKPDDLSFILYRPVTTRRRRRA